MTNYCLLLIFLIAGCSFKKDQIENQTHKGHEELYSSPKAISVEDNENVKRIVIAGTNDVQGKYSTQTLFFRDNYSQDKQSVHVGGIKTIEGYFNILRKKYNNVVMVDSGDIFSGSDLDSVKNFYDTLKYDAVTIGLHDFNLKLPASISSSANLFKNFAQSSSTTLLLSNLYELKTARVVEWPGTKPYLIKEVGGVKVGIIGLIPDDIIPQTPVNNRVGFFVENMLQSTLRHARLMRSLGADIIVVLTHQGVNCGHELAANEKLPLNKVNFEPLRPNLCDLNGAMGEYLMRLPPQLVDVVVGGRHHEKMANFVNGTLLLSSFENGKSFSFAEFFINVKDKKILRDQTVVHQPIMFCHEFFKETNDCYTEDPTVNHKLRVPAHFLGEPVIPDVTSKNEDVSDKKIVETEINHALNLFNADISFIPPTSKESQLLVIELSGNDLIQLLEENYNESLTSHWVPSPFSLQGEHLQLLVSGETIQASKTYKLLSDLEALQKHPILKREILKSNTKTLPHFSWNDLPKDGDDVSVRMSAINR